jgi:hypothetical protein
MENLPKKIDNNNASFCVVSVQQLTRRPNRFCVIGVWDTNCTIGWKSTYIKIKVGSIMMLMIKYTNDFRIIEGLVRK